jgi:hypothetical protein
MRRTTVRTGVLALVALFAALADAPGASCTEPASDAAQPQLTTKYNRPPEGLPRLYYLAGVPDRTFPVWMDEAEVTSASGAIKPGLLEPSVIENLLSTPPVNGCTAVGPVFQQIAGLPRRYSVPEATASSRLVLLGTVAAKSFGFLADGSPGQLLRVIPQEILKGQGRSVDAYYVFMPVGEVILGARKLCKTDRRYPGAPALGDSVVVFVPDDYTWFQDEPMLISWDDGDLIVIHANGRVDLPYRFKRTVNAPDGLLPSIGEHDLLDLIRHSTVALQVTPDLTPADPAPTSPPGQNPE